MIGFEFDSIGSRISDERFESIFEGDSFGDPSLAGARKYGF